MNTEYMQQSVHAISFAADQASIAVISAAAEHARPSVLFRPTLSIDGNQWCALYGESLQCGVAGFGDSPANAMWDFDRNWNAKLLVAPEAKP